jgi:6-phosphofructokinase
MKKANLAVAQSGGPSMVINPSRAGVVLAAKAAGPAVGRILGARHGIDGILKGLRAFNDRTLRADIGNDPEKTLELVERFLHCG